MVFSLRFKIIFITAAILIFAIGVTTLVSSYIFTQEYSNLLQSRTLIIGQGINAQLNRLLDLGLPLEELVGFEKQLQETIATYQDITYIMIVDIEGEILFHNDPAEHHKMITDRATLAAIRQEREVIQPYTNPLGQFQDVFIPIFDRSDTHVGTIRLGFPVELVSQKTTRLAILSGGIGLVSLAVAVTLLVVALAAWVTNPLTKLLVAIEGVRSGKTDLAAGVEINSKDELGTLSAAFNTMAAQLSHSIGSLEEQVSERTRQLETVMAISQRLAVILDLNELLRQLVTITQETFNYYHVHIYLLNEDTHVLQLAEGSGQAGAEMKRRGHHIALDAEQSLVALAARMGQIVKVDNVRETATWLPNPLLPDTYCEAAVPIILEKQVVGVLDVQEDKVAGLDEGDADLLRSLASQVAVAIRNARLFARIEMALAEAQVTQERYLQQTWGAAKNQQQEYYYHRPGSPVVPETIKTELDQAVQSLDESTLVIVHGEGKIGQEMPVLAAPIKFQNQVIGTMQFLETEPSRRRTWTDRELALIQAIADQVAQTAENLRLFDETRERASRERTIREITEKMRAAASLERLVEIAAEELGRRFSAEMALVNLGIDKPAEYSQQAVND